VHGSGVRFIENHTGAIAIGEREDFSEWRYVSVHAEHALSDNEPSARKMDLCAERIFQRVQIEMRVDFAASTAEAHAIDQTGVIECVGEDQVTFSQQRGEQSQVGGVAAAEIKRVFRPGKAGEFALQFFPRRGVPREQPRTGAAHAASFAYGFENRFFQRGVFRQAQIIVAAEVHARRLDERAVLVALRQMPQRVLQFALQFGVKFSWHALRVV